MKRKSLLCLLFSLLMIASMIPFSASALDKETAPAGGPVYYIETYEQLKNLAYTAQADCRYILNDNIEQTDNLNDMEIIIPAGAVFNLNLNGYNIKRSTQGNDCALFRIKSDGRMTINDTSANKTGGCSFSEGYSDYYKAVFYNEGGELEIFGGYYEIFSPYEQGDCSVVRTTSGYTNIYDGTFDSSASWGGDTISVGHYAYLYDTPYVVIFGGDFYGKYMNIDVSTMGNYLEYGKEYPNGSLYPTVYVLGGNFYITNGGKDGEDASFAYCNNGWGRVIVAEGTVLYKCLNSGDQRFLKGVSKKLFTDTIDDYTGGYYAVTAPPMIMSQGLDYYYRLIGLCDKEIVNSYGDSVYEIFKDRFDAVLSNINTVTVSETEKTSPEIKLVNRTADHIYVNWYMCNESDYNQENTEWIHLGNVQNVTQWSFDERPEQAASYIIRAVVTDSDLKTYEDMIRIDYEPLKETETVDSVEIKDIDTPQAGKTPDFDVTAEDSFYINGIFWTDITDPQNKVTLKGTDTFEAGHEYELEVWIRTNEYYNFKTDSDGWIDISAVVGGKEAEVILPGTAISAELTLTYTVSAESTNPTDSTDSTEPSEPTKPSTGDESTPSEPVNPTTPSTGGETKPSDPVEDKGILGDVNHDGKVNIKDATLIQKFAAKLQDFTDAEKFRADVNADTKVNIKDATAIQKFVAKIETGLPIGLPIK